MSKITLANVANLNDTTTSATIINNNSATLVAAIDNTLSRDGTIPNQMSGAIDMNSNRILNLPAAVSDGEPARKVDISNIVLGSLGITVPIGLSQGGTGGSLSATGGTSQVLKQASTGAAVTVGQLSYSDISGTPPTTALTPIRGYISGLTTSNDGVNPNTKINVTSGVAVDDLTTIMISYAGGSINCATTGLNALDTGSLGANSWYHMFLISQANGTSGLLASLSLNSPTFPSLYIYKRRLGSFKTNGSSQIIQYVQFGNNFLWSVPINDHILNNPGSSAVFPTLSVPTNVQVVAQVWFWLANPSNSRLFALITSTNQVDTAPVAGSMCSFANGADGSAYVTTTQSEYRILTNTSGQIRYRLGGTGTGSCSVFVNTNGWFDNL